MPRLAVETRNLTRRFGWRTIAVNNLDLSVPEGSVYVLLGRNGAGKTTTIRMLMGLLARTAGTAAVLGRDPARDTVALRKRIGFVAEDQRMYGWMTVGGIVGFCRPFYPAWDDALQKSLLERFELTEDMRLGSLSRGTYGKVALLLALCHRPDLLILDDPTSGLDPVVRRQFLQGIIELIQGGERTVFFSTHIITEIEQVADHVGIMDKGSLLYSGPLDALKDSVKKIRMVFDGAVPEGILPDDVVRRETVGHELLLTVRNYGPRTLDAAKAAGPRNIEVLDLGLEEIFVSLVAGRAS